MGIQNCTQSLPIRVGLAIDGPAAHITVEDGSKYRGAINFRNITPKLTKFVGKAKLFQVTQHIKVKVWRCAQKSERCRTVGLSQWSNHIVPFNKLIKS